jgi:Derlin-2/3
MSFLGLFSFTAPYLPWVLLIFSCMLGSSPVVDLLGMAAGHVYYFLEDVYPTMTNRRVLSTPAVVRYAFGQAAVDGPRGGGEERGGEGGRAGVFYGNQRGAMAGRAANANGGANGVANGGQGGEDAGGEGNADIARALGGGGGE